MVAERTWEQHISIVVNTVISQVLVSKYYAPLSGPRIFGEMVYSKVVARKYRIIIVEHLRQKIKKVLEE